MTEELIIHGTSGDANITDGVNNDTLKGLGGNPTINGGDGDKNIQRGKGMTLLIKKIFTITFISRKTPKTRISNQKNF